MGKRRDTKIVRGNFVEDKEVELVTSRFVAVEVARNVRNDVLPALKALRMILSFAAMRDGKRRPRTKALCDIVAAIVHATIDEVVGSCHQMACWRERSAASCKGLRKASKRWQQHYTRVVKR